MKTYVGTSGWFYDWNPERSLDWYVANSGLNAVELNASFYRFPFPNQIKSWANKGGGLRWAVKVTRLVTHIHRFSTNASQAWERFYELFAPMDEMVDFYLFQTHPEMSRRALKRVERFIRKIKLGKRLALEWRNPELYTRETEKWAEELGITLVSVDAPGYPQLIFQTAGMVYLRMHGRMGWYQHHYTAGELKEIKNRIIEVRPGAVYIFFNNDQDMLSNARQMMRMFG